MKFEFDKKSWETIEDGEKNCYLLTNGLGGYSSLTIIGAAARGDQALLMSAKRAPNVRMHLVTNMLEKLIVDEKEHILTSQRMKSGEDYKGYQYLEKFVYDDFDENAPFWIFQVDGVTVRKNILMVHNENTVALKYEIQNPLHKKVSLELTPLLRFSSKKELFDDSQNLECYQINHTTDSNENEGTCYSLTGNENQLYVATNAALHEQEPCLFGEMYFSQDERDGREEYGSAFMNHRLDTQTDQDTTVCVILSTKPYMYSASLFTTLVQNKNERSKLLLEQANMASELGKQLVLSADAYVVKRDSTNGMSVIAGYPFFEDWGRDTMISLAGTTLMTGRLEDCKSILRTFAKYVKNGLLPNLFPEGGEFPHYNSVDAPLLFVNSVYEYVTISKDTAFQEEMIPILEQIIDAYQNGTDYHIKMDEDSLIMAGAGFEQLTWMDVRVGDFLPTPRHGKPVEINAYWYNALMVMYTLTQKTAYKELAEMVKASFCEKFWNENEQCLKDVLSGGR